MVSNEINLVIGNDIEIYKNKIYVVNCQDYKENELRMRTDSFDTSIIKGSFKNLNTNLNICSIIYKEVTFENCIFNEETWLDSSSFIRCKFINCNFYGQSKWVDFDKCIFENVHFEMKYMRKTTFKKNCIFSNVTIKALLIDEYIWVLGKRYSQHLVYFDCAKYIQII